MPRFFRSLSLRWKLVGMIGVLLAGIAVFLLFFFPATMESSARRSLEMRASDIALVLSNAVTPGFEFDDSTNVGEILAGLENAPLALHAGLRHEDGTLFAGWKGEQVPPLANGVPDERFIEERDGYLHVVSPVITKTGTRGALIVGFSLAGLEAEKRSIFATVGVVSMAVLVLGLGVALVIGSFVVRPAMELTAVTSRIVRDGDLNQKIQVDTDDEIGQLAKSFAELVEKLKSVPTTLRGSVTDLSRAVADVNELTRSQTSSVQRQAASLSEASATTQEIKQSSSLASTKAEVVLQVATRAEEFSGEGQQAVQASIHGLEEIRSQIASIVQRITDLSERTLQVGEIIESVKDLADQSNVLALNASIEAAKAGEFGKGFSVVAREIRALADQSIQSTARIREILGEIQGAIRATVQITDEGQKRMEQSMEQIKRSGDSLQEMTAIVRESSQAARQIAASVNQQNAGIGQISVAINGLNAAMDETSAGIKQAEGAVDNLRAISGKISSIIDAFRV